MTPICNTPNCNNIGAWIPTLKTNVGAWRVELPHTSADNIGFETTAICQTCRLKNKTLHRAFTPEQLAQFKADLAEAHYEPKGIEFIGLNYELSITGNPNN